MKNIKRLFALLLAVAMLTCLSACGAETGVRSDYNSYDEYSSAGVEAEEAFEGFAEAPSIAEADIDPDVVQSEKSKDGQINPDKIIYTANVTMETYEIDNAIAAVKELVEKEGGFVESSSIRNGNGYSYGYSSMTSDGRIVRVANFTLRVPADRFDTIMDAVGNIGNIPDSSTYSENVTASYYDVKTRMDAYKHQEARLMELMDKAETIEEIIMLEERLADVRYEIEAMQSRLTNWDRQVNFSTINLTIKQVEVYSSETTTTYGEELGLAVKAGLSSALGFLKGALIVILRVLPTIAVLTPIFIGLILLIAKINTKGAAKREARKKALQDKMAKRAAENSEKAAAEDSNTTNKKQ